MLELEMTSQLLHVCLLMDLKDVFICRTASAVRVFVSVCIRMCVSPPVDVP